jgi:hypothetical protein
LYGFVPVFIELITYKIDWIHIIASEFSECMNGSLQYLISSHSEEKGKHKLVITMGHVRSDCVKGTSAAASLD